METQVYYLTYSVGLTSKPIINQDGTPKLFTKEEAKEYCKDKPHLTINKAKKLYD